MPAAFSLTPAQWAAARKRACTRCARAGWIMSMAVNRSTAIVSA